MSEPLPLLDRRALTRLLAGAVGLAMVTVLVLSGMTWRLDALTYDRMLGWRGQQADARVVVVAIDQKSLAELGRWPWSRRVHGKLLDRLSAAGTRSVAFDLLLTEPALHDPEGDALMADAMNRYGRVVLPVAAEPIELNAPAQEELPIPELAAAAAALGHVDLALDADGVARSMFLQAGLGDPHWPSLALAQFQLDDANSPGPDRPLPGQRSRHPITTPYVWSRDYKVLLPYVDPPDGFTRVSYVDVLKGRVPLTELRGKWVLVGVTANGLGDSLRSPLDLPEQRLTGVDYQANALNMLARGDAIEPTSWPVQILASALLLCVPLLLYGLPHLQRAWPLVVATTVLALVISFVLLRFANYWWSPVPVILLVALAGAIATLYTLSRTRRLALTDGLTGLANRGALDLNMEQEVRAARRSQVALSLLMIDVDNFKQLNDSSGHPAGDRVLVALAKILRGRARRPRDLVARLGGDEFAILLPETPSQAAWSIATAIHADLASMQAVKTESGHVTVSIGVHTFPNDRDRIGEDVMGRADAALYLAKQGGRNRTATSAELED